MKKLLTLIAFLACFMGAKAEWVTDYSIDYSANSGFPFYVMGYVPEWVDGIMTDYGADYRYATQADLDGDGDGRLKDGESIVGSVMVGTTEYQKVTGAGPYWHQYFIADGIPTELDGSYTVKALVRASEDVNVNVNMGWGWSAGQQAGTSVSIPASSDFVEVEWEYSGIAGTSCNLVAQPGTSTAVIEWKSLTVSHNAKPQRPTTWQEWLTSDGQPVVVTTTSADISNWMGNAETPWPNANVAFNDQTQNYLVCAWAKEKGRNMNDDGGWDPFPADIEVVDGSHVFVCHGKPATTEGEASAWDNQFWIQSPKSWKSGDQIKVHFRYKASADVSSTDTQIHLQNPSDYLIYHAIGNIHFTEEWQEYDGVMTIADDMAGGWSIAFNLNTVVKDAVDFYFDDLSWQSMVLDEGYFVAGCNTIDGLEYDFDNAVEFVEGDDWNGDECLIATVGEKNAYVNQIMVSTIRGNDAAFKGNTLKIDGTVTMDDLLDWMFSYTPSSLAKITLPGSGIWKIYLDPAYNSMAFEMIEGSETVLPEINPNPTEVVVEAIERDDLADTQNQDGTITINEEEGGTGQPWDNQFWLVSNEPLEKGTETIVQFKYKATKAAKVSTQSHADPGNYLHWAAIGDVNFTEEWQDFNTTFVIPNEADGMKSIAFNMSEIRDANNYHLKDFVWKLADGTKSLIDQTGTKNFVIKILGSDPVQVGIETIRDDSSRKGNGAIYNIAGQRVTKDYKGIVIKDGKKYISR